MAAAIATVVLLFRFTFAPVATQVVAALPNEALDLLGRAVAVCCWVYVFWPEPRS